MSSSHPGDVAAEWTIHQADGIHAVKLEHGTTSGKRVITVDGEEVRSCARIYERWPYQDVASCLPILPPLNWTFFHTALPHVQ